MKEKAKRIGNAVFFSLVFIGFIDMAVQAATDGRIEIIQGFLRLVVPQWEAQ